MLPDHHFLDTLRSLIVFATTFKMDYGAPFVEAKMTDIAQNVFVSNFVPGDLATYIRNVLITKFVLPKPSSLAQFENAAASTLKVTHLDDKCIASCLDTNAVLLMKAASAYLLSPARPKGSLLCSPFYSVADRQVKALHALFHDIRTFSNGIFL